MTTLREVAKELRDKFDFKWMFGLDEDLDHHLSKIVEDSKLNPKKPRLNPYLYLEHLTDIGSLLDRCLIYRREYNDMFAAQINQALQYDLFMNQLDAAKELEMAAWEEDLNRVQAEGFTAAAAKFAAAQAKSPLASGFATLNSEHSRSSLEAAEGQRTRQNLVGDRWKSLVRHQNFLKLAHDEHGNPLNYKDRAKRARDLLTQDFSEALLRAEAAAAGITLLGGSSELPFVEKPRGQPLDEFIDWARGAVRWIDTALQHENECTFVIPFAKGRIIGDPPQEISFDWKLPIKAKHLRIREVGLSLVVKNLADVVVQEAHYVRASFALFLPNKFKNGVRSTLTFDNVGLAVATSSAEYASGRGVINAGQDEGPWVLRFIGPGLRSSNAQHETMRWSHLHDVNLHLRAAVVFEN